MENTTLVSLKNTEKYAKLPKILVMGVGGGGCNAINNMMEKNIEGVEFVAVNTDAQSLSNSKSKNTLQIGLNTTKGQGAGSFPEIALSAAEESKEEIESILEGVELLFLTAGMGGGTGTGATPYIAKLAREKDILIVAVVTKPFEYEAESRLKLAEKGISELRKYVDTMIVLPNENLFRIANKETTLKEAFAASDEVLYLGVKGITDLITTPGLINLDFADVRMVIKKMGRAMMGMGEASGENRAIKAVEEALSNPLIEDVNIKGATGALINITGSPDMTLFEFNEAARIIREKIGENQATIKVGSAFSKELEDKVRVSIFATGMEENSNYINKDDIYDYEQEQSKISNKINSVNQNKEYKNELKSKKNTQNYQKQEDIFSNAEEVDNENSFGDIFTHNKKEENNIDIEKFSEVQKSINVRQNREVRSSISMENRLSKNNLETNAENRIKKELPKRTSLTRSIGNVENNNEQEYFDIGNLQNQDNIVEKNEKNSILFGFFNNFSSKKNKKGDVEKGAIYKSKNSKIEIKNNSNDGDIDENILNIPTYLRNEKI